MISGRNPELQLGEPVTTTLRLRKHGAGWYRVASLLFAHKAVSETIPTRVHLNASPEAVWNHIMFYEEVPGRPPFLLRALLPCPYGTEGDKTRIGATVRCVYKGGDLVKRIDTVEPLHLLQFEIMEQRLGIESCIVTRGGSYQIYSCGNATDVVLVTNYHAYLHPRWVWRPLEALLVRQLHRHILRGVSASIFPRDQAICPAAAERLAPQCASSGDLACIASPSRSRR